ncbi:MAG: hypothetical protein H7252_02395 [Cytophaga sp.]|nr:hypothetical protein [Undibacterium sp.]
MEISGLRAELARRAEAQYFWKNDGAPRKVIGMKYAFIERHRILWPISVQVGVSGGALRGAKITSSV